MQTSFNPFMPVAPKKRRTYFDDISLTKAIFRKILKEKCLSKSNPQLSFKYFVNLKLVLNPYAAGG